MIFKKIFTYSILLNLSSFVLASGEASEQERDLKIVHLPQLHNARSEYLDRVANYFSSFKEEEFVVTFDEAMEDLKEGEPEELFGELSLFSKIVKSQLKIMKFIFKKLDKASRENKKILVINSGDIRDLSRADPEQMSELSGDDTLFASSFNLYEAEKTALLFLRELEEEFEDVGDVMEKYNIMPPSDAVQENRAFVSALLLESIDEITLNTIHPAFAAMLYKHGAARTAATIFPESIHFVPEDIYDGEEHTIEHAHEILILNMMLYIKDFFEKQTNPVEESFPLETLSDLKRLGLNTTFFQDIEEARLFGYDNEACFDLLKTSFPDFTSKNIYELALDFINDEFHSQELKALEILRAEYDRTPEEFWHTGYYILGKGRKVDGIARKKF